MRDRDLYRHEPAIKFEDRWKANGYKSCVIWFTGLSASGKSTLANGLEKVLHDMGVKSYRLYWVSCGYKSSFPQKNRMAIL